MNLGPIAFFRKYKLTSSSGKKEDFESAHIACLMYNLLKSRKGSEDVSISFHRNIAAREKELTNLKELKEKYLVRISVRDIFGFATHQENATYSLRYKLTFQRISDNNVLSHRPAVGVTDAD